MIKKNKYKKHGIELVFDESLMYWSCRLKPFHGGAWNGALGLLSLTE